MGFKSFLIKRQRSLGLKVNEKVASLQKDVMTISFIV